MCECRITYISDQVNVHIKSTNGVARQGKAICVKLFRGSLGLQLIDGSFHGFFALGSGQQAGIVSTERLVLHCLCRLLLFRRSWLVALRLSSLRLQKCSCTDGKPSCCNCKYSAPRKRLQSLICNRNSVRHLPLRKYTIQIEVICVRSVSFLDNKA